MHKFEEIGPRSKILISFPVRTASEQPESVPFHNVSSSSAMYIW